MLDIHNHNLKAYNTFGIDAGCARFVEFCSEDELRAFLQSEGASLGEYLILGGGSNLLLTGDYPGTVLRSAIKGIESTDDGDSILVSAGSGEVWDDFVALCIERGWHGAENLSGIPGDVGASAVQNIGAYGVEVKDIIYKVEAIEIATAQPRTFTNEECQYAYRQSRFKQDWKNRYIITRVVYRLKKTFEPHLDYGNIRQQLTSVVSSDITSPDSVSSSVTSSNIDLSAVSAADVRRAVIAIRNEKLPDPRIEGNAGSFFMNPIVDGEKYKQLAVIYPTMPHYPMDGGREKIPAGWMIEQCGWKGKTIGRAGVHARQALVLVNRGGAMGAEIVSLCDAIRHDVNERFGIDIHPEVNIV